MLKDMNRFRFRSWLVIGLALAAVAHAVRPPARAQSPDVFPRTLADGTGRRITVPARPLAVAMVGDSPELRALLEPTLLRQAEPLSAPDTLDWANVGLLVISDLYAAVNPAWLNAAEARAVPVFQVSAINSLDDWRAAIAALGYATGRDGRAAELLERLERRLEHLAAKFEDRPERRVIVLSPEGYTFGRDTLITDLLAAVRARNVAAEAGFDDYRQIDDETLARLAPDVILLSPAWSAAQIARLRDNPTLAGLPAIRRGQMFRLEFSPTLPDDPAAAAFLLAFILHSAPLLF